MLKKILVPVDGSEPSWCALEYAREPGEKFGGSITVVHVIPQAYTMSLAGPIPYVPDNIGVLEDSGEKLMDQAREKLAHQRTEELRRLRVDIFNANIHQRALFPDRPAHAHAHLQPRPDRHRGSVGAQQDQVLLLYAGEGWHHAFL